LPFLLQASWLHGRHNSPPIGVRLVISQSLRAWLDAILLTPEVLGFPVGIFSWQARMQSSSMQDRPASSTTHPIRPVKD
jgi:hypothetical protein